MRRVCSPLPLAGEGAGERAGASNAVTLDKTEGQGGEAQLKMPEALNREIAQLQTG